MKVRINTGELAQTDKRFGLTSGMKKIQGEVCEAKKMDDNYWVSKPGSEDQCPYVFDYRDVEEVTADTIGASDTTPRSPQELVIDALVLDYVVRYSDIDPESAAKLSHVQDELAKLLEQLVREDQVYTPAQLAAYLIARYTKD